MTDPITANTATGGLHGRNSPLPGVVRETITFESSQIGPVETVMEDTLCGTQNRDNRVDVDVDALVDDGSQGMPPIAQATTFRTRATRNKTKFAKQRVLATSALFLNPAHRGCFTDSLVEITGKIEECPRAVNGHRYRIDWRPKSKNRPLPPNLLPEYLREFYENTLETKVLLQAAMARYDEVYGNGEMAPVVTANIDGVRVPVSTPRRGGKGPKTPPQIARGHAASAARTTASLSSVSTLTQPSESGNSSFRAGRRVTRATAGEDIFDSGASSDIEDGDDLEDDDDDYQMRFMGGIPEVSDEDDDENDKDHNEEETTAQHEEKCTVTQILKGLDWQFKRLKENEAIEDEHQPEYYDGPSGLKPGVEDTFVDPLACLGYAGGLDYKFVVRYYSKWANKCLCICQIKLELGDTSIVFMEAFFSLVGGTDAVAATLTDLASFS